MLLEILLGLSFISYALFYKLILLRFKVLNIIFLLGLLFLISMIIFLVSYGSRDNISYQEDAIIILGAGVHKDKITLTLANRLNKALEYIQKNNKALIIVSGAQGFQEDLSEASAMQKYLLDNNKNNLLSLDKIIIKEERAKNTYQNFLYSKEILDKLFINKSDYKIIFITNDFHIYRATQLAKRAGFKNISHINSKSIYYSLPACYLREVLAVLKLWLIK